MYAIGRAWLSPIAPTSHIRQSPRALPLYALYSVVRISVAYALSLVFALAYGYVAASSRRAEIILVPLLDILQSIPVLSFLPGVMLAMVAIFPHKQIGVELGSILLIFTGQVWNIAFSFYSSLRASRANCAKRPSFIGSATGRNSLSSTCRFQRSVLSGIP